MKYGTFENKLGGYTINKLPQYGAYEYIYKNHNVLVKVDQYGIQSAQMDAPAGIVLVKREKREQFSPIINYFEVDGKVYHNFDVFSASNLKIEFLPEKAVYTLFFQDIVVKTEVAISENEARFFVSTEIINNSGGVKQIKICPTVYPYVNDLLMAPWDKPEWYTKTKLIDDGFATIRYSVNGKVEERRVFSCLFNKPLESRNISRERLVSVTKNYSILPLAFSKDNADELYAFEQCYSGTMTASLKSKESYKFTQIFSASNEEDFDCVTLKSKEYLDEKNLEIELDKVREKYKKLLSVNSVKTEDETFNSFVNGFLPLELDWVISLDRGWPTGMRGVRDCSTDFYSYINYDIGACKDTIRNLLSKQKSNGWFPRQIPTVDGGKYDLRDYIDSACVFIDFLYNYLAYSEDFSVLMEKYRYFDSEQLEDGFTHLEKAINYYLLEENIGEHGLIKMHGGDWLDCLYGVGMNGRGEGVMVSCQLIICINHFIEIANKFGKDIDEQYYKNVINKLTKNVNECFNEKGFYNGVFTDNGEWIFSSNDPDGKERFFVPTNAFAIMSGVAKGKEEKIVENYKKLRTSNGYKLFTYPMGEKKIEKIGKMGTGDFLPYFCENASVYSHGSQGFMAMAAASIGDYNTLLDILNCIFPFNSEIHSEDRCCSAPYAITNVYHLVPYFCGRSGFSFLTGSVATLFRILYEFTFGLKFTMDGIKIKPCIPKRYKNSNVKFNYNGKTLNITYVGFGSTVKEVSINGKIVLAKENSYVIDRRKIKDINEITVEFA